MAEEKSKEYPVANESREEPADPVSAGDVAGNAAKGETPEGPSNKKSAGLSAEQDRAADKKSESPATGAGGDWFVDFDVWEAVLEANFGPDFETVLSRELGPDWMTKLNGKMISTESFYNVVEEIKKEITGKTIEDSEVETENFSENQMSFETLGPGEVIYDSKYTSDVPTKRYAGKRAPNLMDLTRKEFVEGKTLDVKQSPPPVDKVIDDKDDVINDELVLMERSDFSKLSYYAHKELERHTSELKLKEVLNRKSELEVKKPPASGLFRFLAAGSFLLFFYFIFCCVSYLACGYYSGTLLEKLSPDLKFRPSSSLHKQGELSWIENRDRKTGETPVVLYFLLPSVKKLEINSLRTGATTRYDLGSCTSTRLVIPRGPEGDSVSVVKNYTRLLPSNLGGLLHESLLTLSLNGRVVLSAYETGLSSLLPGLTRFEITDGQEASVAEAYVAGDRLNIRVEGLNNLSAAEFNRLTTRLLLLFSLLRI